MKAQKKITIAADSSTGIATLQKRLACLRYMRNIYARPLPERRVSFTKIAPETFRKVLPMMGHITHLSLSDMDTQATSRLIISALAESPHLRNLRSLYIGVSTIAYDALQCIKASPLMARLEALEINFCFVAPMGIYEVLKKADLSNLKRLSFKGTNIHPTGAVLLGLTKNPRARKIQTLDLCNIADMKLVHLVFLLLDPASSLRSVKELQLSRHAFTDTDIEEFRTNLLEKRQEEDGDMQRFLDELKIVMRSTH